MHDGRQLGRGLMEFYSLRARSSVFGLDDMRKNLKIEKASSYLLMGGVTD